MWYVQKIQCEPVLCMHVFMHACALVCMLGCVLFRVSGVYLGGCDLVSILYLCFGMFGLVGSLIGELQHLFE